MPSTEYNEIIFPFPNPTAVDVWVWMNDFSHFIIHVSKMHDSVHCLYIHVAMSSLWLIQTFRFKLLHVLRSHSTLAMINQVTFISLPKQDRSHWAKRTLFHFFLLRCCSVINRYRSRISHHANKKTHPMDYTPLIIFLSLYHVWYQNKR